MRSQAMGEWVYCRLHTDALRAANFAVLATNSGEERELFHMHQFQGKAWRSQAAWLVTSGGAKKGNSMMNLGHFRGENVVGDGAKLTDGAWFSWEMRSTGEGRLAQPSGHSTVLNETARCMFGL